jgi:hypothetical protein
MVPMTSVSTDDAPLGGLVEVNTDDEQGIGEPDEDIDHRAALRERIFFLDGLQRFYDQPEGRTLDVQELVGRIARLGRLLQRMNIVIHLISSCKGRPLLISMVKE